MHKEKPKRIQFDFSPDALDQLDKLVGDTDASSKAEVIRNALRLYEYTVNMLSNNFELTFRRGEELKYVELLINIKRGGQEKDLVEEPVIDDKINIMKTAVYAQ